jgi:hypothetical protein
MGYPVVGDAVYCEARIAEGRQANGQIIYIDWQSKEVVVLYFLGNTDDALKGGDSVSYDLADFQEFNHKYGDGCWWLDVD